jgi:hypothetical protein
MRVGRASTRLERHTDALAFLREGQPEPVACPLGFG